MEPIQQIVSDEDVSKVKAEEALKNNPPRPVFKKSFANGKIQFLYSWITDAAYQDIIGKESYQKGLEKDPETARRYLQIKVLEQCVLWPKTFNPATREELQPYPAGVISGLMDAIMFASGFTTDAAPDTVLLAPPQPTEATDEEILQIMAERATKKQQTQPGYRDFGVAFEKPFFVRDFDFDANQYRLVPTRYYVYVPVDRATFLEARDASNEEQGMLTVLNDCVIWPKEIDWASEPANYCQWVFEAIMLQSGFGTDPSSDVEEV